MKPLEALRAGQQRWEYKGRKYSIVDLTAWPERSPKPPGSRWEEIMAFYKPYQFELADTTGDTIEIVGRYQSFDEGQAAIKLLDGNQFVEGED